MEKDKQRKSVHGCIQITFLRGDNHVAPNIFNNVSTAELKNAWNLDRTWQIPHIYMTMILGINRITVLSISTPYSEQLPCLINQLNITLE